MRKPGILFCLFALLSQAACGNFEPLRIKRQDPVRTPYLNVAHSERLSAKAYEEFGHDQCAIQFSGIEDARSNKNVLGSVAGRTVYMDGLDKRLNHYLSYHLANSGWISLVEPEGSPDDAIMMSGDLLKAHIGSSSTSMVTNIAVRIRFDSPGEAQRQVLLRGKDVSLNWNSGDEEIQDSVSAAIGDLVQKAAGVILPECQKLAEQAGRKSVSEKSAVSTPRKSSKNGDT